MPRLVVPPPRFTHEEWSTSSRRKHHAAEKEREWAEKLEAESKRLRDESVEVMQKAQEDVKRTFEQRIKDTTHWKSELQDREQRLFSEIDALEIYKKRLEQALEATKPYLKITLQCLSIREQRLGIDLVHDDVQKELLKELDVIKGAQAILQRTIEEATEQLRILRKAQYHIQNDLRDKDKALEIDVHANELKYYSTDVELKDGDKHMMPSRTSMEEWESFTRNNLLNADRAENGSLQLRTIIDNILKQVAKDMQVQCEKVNCAFEIRIKETKEAKQRLEGQLFELIKRVRDMECNIAQLEKSILEKQRILALAQTKLRQRQERPNVEQCRDEVESRLMIEVREMEEMILRLEEKLKESKASLRNLLRNQLIIEEDINVKINTLDTDDVMCMSIRQSIMIAPY